MKERPILFNTAMVKAILEGRKTQTRRIVKPQPVPYPGGGHWWRCDYVQSMVRVEQELQNPCELYKGFIEEVNPFGSKGDRLWVRETFCYGRIEEWDAEHPDDRRLYVDQDNASIKCLQPIPKQWCLENNVDIEEVRWKPSIHMPRSACRIVLEITNIRIEQLNQISADDAEQEGLVKLPASGRYVVNRGDQYFGEVSRNPQEVFKWLWESIYGSNSWEINPWVWVIEFKIIQGGEA